MIRYVDLFPMSWISRSGEPHITVLTLSMLVQNSAVNVTNLLDPTLGAVSLCDVWAVLEGVGSIIVGHLWPLTWMMPMILLTVLLTLLLMPLSTRLGKSPSTK